MIVLNKWVEKAILEVRSWVIGAGFVWPYLVALEYGPQYPPAIYGFALMIFCVLSGLFTWVATDKVVDKLDIDFGENAEEGGTGE